MNKPEELEYHFVYQCPCDWEELIPTGAFGVKRCPHCNNLVHRISGIEEASPFIRAGECVAFLEAGEMRVGLLDSGYPGGTAH